MNVENKRLGKDAMKLAIKNHGIAAEQFSRPGHSAQENAICKRLLFDYIRTSRQPFGMCACNLKSCYDCIVHTAASIALQCIGVPLGKIKGMFGAVQKLIHHARSLGHRKQHMVALMMILLIYHHKGWDRDAVLDQLFGAF